MSSSSLNPEINIVDRDLELAPAQLEDDLLGMRVKLNELVPAVSSSPSGTEPVRKEGVLVSRVPGQLRPHRVLDEIGWTDLDELNEAARRKLRSVREPILITKNGTILSGVGSWQLALFEGRQQITCVQYDIDENESLQYILALHRTRRTWNSFVSIRIALKLEPYFQQKAVENMRTGGKYKGSTNLSKADRIEVRQEVATAAGSGVGNVDKVKTLLQSAHPNIIKALQNGSLRIHRAWKWCRLPKSQQKEVFAKYDEDQTRRRILREFKSERSRARFDSAKALEALRSFEAGHPGQIEFRISTKRNTVVLLGHDLINEIKIPELSNGIG
jgi:hypothetical protein